MQNPQPEHSPSQGTSPLARQEFVARWVFTGEGAPIAWGRIIVEAGRIVSIDSDTASPQAVVLAEGAILPSLCNAHTHLEFSHLTTPMGDSGGTFARWLRDVIVARRQEAEWRQTSSEAIHQEKFAAVKQGEAESRQYQVRAVGEIATPGGPQEYWQAARLSPPSCSSADDLQVNAYLEILGLSPERQEELLEVARQYLQTMQGPSPGGRSRVMPGLSPHAPYTIGIDLLSKLCDLAAAKNVPVAMHLAESWEELELLRSHSGELCELLRSLGAWYPGAVPRGLVPLDLLEILARAPQSLVVHGNFLTEEDWKYLAQQRDRMSVVYCPRTHAYFAHGAYPLREMLNAGVRVALGTDSRASNPNLSLWDEMKFVAHQHPHVTAAEVLRAGTLSGAEGLGLAADLGTIKVGKRGDLTLVHGGPSFADAMEGDAALAILLRQGELARG